MSTLRLAIVQMDVILGERKANYEKIRNILRSKKDSFRAPAVVILPEMWDVGYAIEEAEKYGDKGASSAVSFLASLAAEFNCWFAGGSVLALTDQGAANRALVIDPSGRFVADYDKAHLIPLMDEEKYLLPGEKRTRLNIEGTDTALAICYDLRFPELTRRYAAEGAELQIFSAEWPISRIDHWRTLLKARAIENMIYVAGCNRVGTTGETLFGGASAVIDPWGKVLYEGGNEEEIAFVDIDTSKVKKARDFLRVFEMRRPELY